MDGLSFRPLADARHRRRCHAECTGQMGGMPLKGEPIPMTLAGQAPQVDTGEEAARAAAQAAGRVLFAVKGIYGLSKHSIRLPLNETEWIESGQICATADPDADPSCNLGVIDYERGA